MRFRRVRARLEVSLHPSELADVQTAVAARLDGLLLRYKPSLGGVVLAHAAARAKLGGAAGGAPLLPYIPHVQVPVEAELTVLAPKLGERAQGIVTAVSADVVSLLTAGCKAVVACDKLEAARWAYDAQRRVWRCLADDNRSVCEGSEVDFVVQGVRDLSDDVLEEVELLGALEHEGREGLGRCGGAHARDAPLVPPTTPTTPLLGAFGGAHTSSLSGLFGGGHGSLSRRRVSFANGEAAGKDKQAGKGKRKREDDDAGAAGGAAGGAQGGGADAGGGGGTAGTPLTPAEKRRNKKRRKDQRRKEKAAAAREAANGGDGGNSGGAENGEKSLPMTPAANGGETPEARKMREQIAAMQAQLDSLTKAADSAQGGTPASTGGQGSAKKKKKKKYKGGAKKQADA